MGKAERVTYDAPPGHVPPRRNIRLGQARQQLYCKEARVPLLTRITGPRDLDRLSLEELGRLAEEIRTFLVDAVSKTGGHLGPNLGVVELTLALHRVFDSPKDKVLWDTGHQSYVHKLLTGRQDFSKLKMKGRPVRLPLAGRVRARRHREQPRLHRPRLGRRHRQGQPGPRPDDHVVAVIGDGARSTGGMAWEALNNIAAAKGPPPRHRRQRQRGAPTRPPSAASPTTWRPCAPPTATSASWPAPRTSWSAPRSSAAHSTTPCTAPRRA